MYLLLAVWLTSPFTLNWYDEHRTHGRKLRPAVTLLHRIPDPASTAEMIEAMEAGDALTSALAAKSLAQLLPKLTEADGAILRTKYRAGLQRALHGCNTNLILAILNADEKILG